MNATPICETYLLHTLRKPDSKSKINQFFFKTNQSGNRSHERMMEKISSHVFHRGKSYYCDLLICNNNV